MKAMTRGALAVVFLFVVGGGFVAQNAGAGIEDQFDQDLFSILQARTIDDAQGLIDFYLVERTGFLPILPPGDEEFVQPVAPIPAYLPDLPEVLLNNLIGEEIAPAVVGYRVYLAEEVSETGGRRWLVMNADSEILWSEWAPTGYDPLGELALLYPDLVAAAEEGDPSAVAEWDALKLWRDPARLILTAYIVSTDDLINYVWAESLARGEEDSFAALGALGGMIMSSGPYSSSNLWLEINGVTNGCTGYTADLTIHTPTGDTNSSYDIYSSSCALVTHLVGSVLVTNLDWQFLMRCPTNIIGQTNIYARYLCEDRGLFGLMETTNCDLIVMTNITAQAMAEMLVPPWVTVANATNIGAIVARGAFTNGTCCGLPIERGVILSSGPITNAIGPNTDSGWTAYEDGSANLHYPGNTNLDDLVGGTNSYDASILAFDIVSTNSFVLQFQYVFASEEYPEYSGSEYNDLMAVFVSTNRVGAQWIIDVTNNIVQVPCTSNVTIAVNRISGGCTAPPYSPTNALYYVDNHDPMSAGPAVAPYASGESVFNIEYDGMTVLLTAQTLVSANVTNRVEIGIEDYSEESYDSAIFLRAWSPDSCP